MDSGPELGRHFADRLRGLAGCLSYRPLVLDAGRLYFASPRLPPRIIVTERIGEDAVRVTCVPA